jgi:hypothetical protein
LNNTGYHGHGWSSSPGGSSTAYYLYFDGGDVRPASNNYRTHGLTVRCVKEFISVCLLFVIAFPFSVKKRAWSFNLVPSDLTALRQKKPERNCSGYVPVLLSYFKATCYPLLIMIRMKFFTCFQIVFVLDACGRASVALEIFLRVVRNFEFGRVFNANIVKALSKVFHA